MTYEIQPRLSPRYTHVELECGLHTHTHTLTHACAILRVYMRMPSIGAIM